MGDGDLPDRLLKKSKQSLVPPVEPAQDEKEGLDAGLKASSTRVFLPEDFFSSSVKSSSRLLLSCAMPAAALRSMMFFAALERSPAHERVLCPTI
jgi:hypothetical protein